MNEKGEGVVSVGGRSNALLSTLAKRVPLTKLRRAKGICVVQGPGSFTAVRTGVLVANLLSRLTQKPLVAISVDGAQDLGMLAKMLSDGLLPVSSTVLPVYDAEPNITVKTC
jgi:hypothetical protein